MKLCREATIESVTEHEDYDGHHSEEKVTAMPDAEILALFYKTGCWDYAVDDGYTVEMVDGLDPDGGGLYAPAEVKAIIQTEAGYGFQLFLQPYNKFTNKMVSDDQGGEIEGFEALEKMCNGQAEWLWCFDDDQMGTVMHQLELLGVTFVVRDLLGDDAFDFGEDK